MNRESGALPLAALGGGVALGLALAFSLHAPARLLSLVSRHGAPHRLDGREAPGEYRFRWSDQASALAFAWSIEGDRLLGAVSSPDTGWVAVGFGGEGPLMYGSDIVIGYVDARGAHLHDHFASTPTSHDPDAVLGGGDDVLAAAGLQTAAGTTIEFERPLAARDTTDQPIVSGRTHVIMASSEADDFTSYHFGGRKAVALVDLFEGPPSAAERAVVLPDHLSDVQIMLATWMTLLLVVGVHGVASGWTEGRTRSPGGGPGGAGGAALTDAGVVPLALLLLVEVLALCVFGVAIWVAGPIWLLGLALALGLLALAGIVILYARAFVPWEVVRTERDDGIPW